MNDPVSQLYIKYIVTNPSGRLAQAILLEKAANIILDSEEKALDGDVHAQYHFLSIKIAQDLYQHALNMSHSKAYEFSPKINLYFELAFKLAKKYWGWNAPNLLPYIKDVLYYKKDDTELIKIYKECLTAYKKSMNYTIGI